VSYKGIKTLGRLNEVSFYLSICLIIIPAGILAYGSFLNLTPVFGSGLKNIVKGSKNTVFAYSGMEIIFLIYPFLQQVFFTRSQKTIKMWSCKHRYCNIYLCMGYIWNCLLLRC